MNDCRCSLVQYNKMEKITITYEGNKKKLQADNVFN